MAPITAKSQGENCSAELGSIGGGQDNHQWRESCGAGWLAWEHHELLRPPEPRSFERSKAFVDRSAGIGR